MVGGMSKRRLSLIVLAVLVALLAAAIVLHADAAAAAMVPILALIGAIMCNLAGVCGI